MYKFYQEEFERSRALPDSIAGLETSHMNEKKERSELAKATSKLNSESTNPWQKAQQEKKKGINTGSQQFYSYEDKLQKPLQSSYSQKQKYSGIYGNTVAQPVKKQSGRKKNPNGVIDNISEYASILLGGYTPERPVVLHKSSYMPDIIAPPEVAGWMNYNSMRDIDKWEKEKRRMNKAHERRVNSMKRNSLTSPFAKAYEKLMDYKILRELAFPFKSPVHMAAAIDIGPGINDSNNLSSVSNRFAGKIKEHFDASSEEYKKKHYISEPENAMRHTIWQAVLASQYNPQVAYDAAMSHETRPYTNIDRRSFANEADADMVTDLLNNEIGRRIGTNNKRLDRKGIALIALREYWQNGLFTYEKGNDGMWHVVKRRISDDVYNAMYNKYIGLDNNGR